MTEPRAARPKSPGYGFAPPDGGSGLLPWSWAVERLETSHNYWVASVHPAGRPHVMPVWGCWVDGRFVFSTGRDSRKARNLAANPEAVVTTESADEAVIVEGRLVTLDADALSRFVDAYEAKYAWRVNPASDGIFAIQPGTVFGFIEHDSQFTGTATRWRFAGEANAP